MSDIPEVGSEWLDRDKRMLSGNRRVRIVSADDNIVKYVSAVYPLPTPFRSRTSRFVKAFRRADEKSANPA